jgi:SPP1 gp7 family putative phage head morphogenesis protein
MGSTPTPVLLKQNPTDPLFWNEERELLLKFLFPFLLDSIKAGALHAFDEIAAQADLGIAWDLINEAVINWANQYTASVVSQISKTSMAAFLDAFEPWVRSGEPLSSLIDALTPFYGAVRAEMVAVTETTRAYAQGNLATWKATGVVEGFNVMTSEDELVCPICSAKQAGNPYPVDAEVPAYHVNCRCWIAPVVNPYLNQ